MFSFLSGSLLLDLEEDVVLVQISSGTEQGIAMVEVAYCCAATRLAPQEDASFQACNFQNTITAWLFSFIVDCVAHAVPDHGQSVGFTCRSSKASASPDHTCSCVPSSHGC